MTVVSLATCAQLPDGDEDSPALVEALAWRGVEARLMVWDDRRSDAAGELVVLRSTWDYTHRAAEFIAWVSGLPRVANPAAVVRWSTDKRYLGELDAAGVPVVPTSFVAPGEPVELPDAAEYVLKPSVGAGSRGAGRFAAARADDARDHAAALHRAGRTVLVQPYLSEVDTSGETALVYVDGAFSHAIGKAALLPSGYTHPVGGASLYAKESITAHEPSAAERRVGELALDVIRSRFGADQLYARVDLLQSPSGPVVTELELVEPSLFLGYSPQAADTLAAAIAARA